MTFVGKLLVVIHLILSVLFMAFAGAVFTAQTNWRTEVEAQRKQVTRLKSELQTAITDSERQKTADNERVVNLDTQVAELTGSRNNLQTENARLLAENKSLRVAYDGERELARLNSLEADERVQESGLQRERNQVLYSSRNELVTKVQELEDKLFETDVLKNQYDEKNRSLLKDLATMRGFLISKGLPSDPKQMVAQAAPPPQVRGVVVDAKAAETGSSQMVEISLGSDDGLNLGHTLTVFGQDKYLGQIRIVYVTADRAVGTVVVRAKNTTIQKGDNVTTEL